MLSTTRGAAAEPPAADRLATLLGTAEQATKARQWQSCVDALKEAVTLDGSAKTRGDLGLCEEGAGQLTEAYADLSYALTQVPPETRRMARWLGFQASFDRVKARTVPIVFTMSPYTAFLLVDGRPLGRVDGRTIALRPGEHTFVARETGYQTLTRTESLTLSKGTLTEPRNIDFTLAKLPTVAPDSVIDAASKPVSGLSPSSAAGTASTPAQPFDTRRVALVVGIASGAAALGFGALTIGLEVDRASMTRGHAGNACTGFNAASAFCVEVRERRDQRDAATGLAMGFGALAGAAVLTALLGGPSGQDSRPRVAPILSAHGAGVGVQGSF
ncbi:MAG: hypothetical protein U0441_39005 [Polyangiaceae bacterium]